MLIPLDLYLGSSRKREPLGLDRLDFPADAAAAGAGCVPKSPALPATRHFPGEDESFGPFWAILGDGTLTFLEVLLNFSDPDLICFHTSDLSGLKLCRNLSIRWNGREMDGV